MVCAGIFLEVVVGSIIADFCEAVAGVVDVLVVFPCGVIDEVFISGVIISCVVDKVFDTCVIVDKVVESAVVGSIVVAGEFLVLVGFCLVDIVVCGGVVFERTVDNLNGGTVVEGRVSTDIVMVLGIIIVDLGVIRLKSVEQV